MILIINYGLGNLKSIQNMLVRLGADTLISDDPADIHRADKLILPGVGNFGHGMRQLAARGLTDELGKFALEQKKPVLGICLGAQILGKGSEEAPGVSGLGWVDMYCRRFPPSPEFRVPHMGWNTIRLVKDHKLFQEMDTRSRFYFVHSYYMHCENPENILAQTDYGIRYTSVVSASNIIGTQFHPEKSHRFGMAMMKQFIHA